MTSSAFWTSQREPDVSPDMEIAAIQEHIENMMMRHSNLWSVLGLVEMNAQKRAVSMCRSQPMCP